LNVVVNYSLFSSWLENYLKSINTGDIFKAAITKEKFAISKRHVFNGNMSTLRMDDLLFVLAAV